MNLVGSAENFTFANNQYLWILRTYNIVSW
jgi:hypothetical protein